MSDTPCPIWQPKTFLRFERHLTTSALTALIVTDAGRAYLKPMAPALSPHTLACEWVGSQLARWFGLPTFEFALMPIDEIDEIPLADNSRATPGMAFASREMRGHPWSGAEKELEQLENPQDISRLVVFDTWTQNCDRFPPAGENRGPHYDNVFLAHAGAAEGKLRLIAMDHTHCFTCGADLTGRLANIHKAHDDGIYGLFPAFVPRMDKIEVRAAADTLRRATTSVVEPMVQSIPAEWEVSQAIRIALVQLVCSRAAYVADRIYDSLKALCWPQEEFDFDQQGGPP